MAAFATAALLACLWIEVPNAVRVRAFSINSIAAMAASDVHLKTKQAHDRARSDLAFLVPSAVPVVVGDSVSIQVSADAHQQFAPARVVAIFRLSDNRGFANVDGRGRPKVATVHFTSKERPYLGQDSPDSVSSSILVDFGRESLARYIAKNSSQRWTGLSEVR